jgi:hypothetical protein
MSGLVSGNITLGSGYQYMNFIKNPGAAGSTANGTLTSLETNKDVLVGYATSLWDGGPNNPVISTSNVPLGNAFFYNTGQNCKIDNSDSSSNDTTIRYVYINNIPTGSLGGAIGILPGIIEKMEEFNPQGFFEELVTLGTPTCKLVTLEVIDDNGNSSYESNYVALTDIQSICNQYFEDGTNPLGSVSCTEGYQNLNKKPKKKKINYFNIFIIIFIIFIIIINF